MDNNKIIMVTIHNVKGVQRTPRLECWTERCSSTSKENNAAHRE